MPASSGHGTILPYFAPDVCRRRDPHNRGPGVADIADDKLHDDADEVTGTAATDDAIGFNPLPLPRLHEYGAVVAVIGQVASIMHGSRELTSDLDLL